MAEAPSVETREGSAETVGTVALAAERVRAAASEGWEEGSEAHRR